MKSIMTLKPGLRDGQGPGKWQRVALYSYSVVTLPLSCTVCEMLKLYRSVTDRQTDKQSEIYLLPYLGDAR